MLRKNCPSKFPVSEFPLESSLAKLLLLVACSGCGILPSVGPDYVPPRFPTPQNWSNSSSGDAQILSTEQAGSWWKILGDQNLDKIVADALTSNKSLAIIESRVRETRENREASFGAFFPQINFGAGYSKNKVSQNTVQGALFGNNAIRGARLLQKNWELGFDALWELDLFGGIRRSYEAADAQVENMEEQYRDAQISLIAEVVRTYFEIRAYEKRLSIARENIRIQTESLDIVKSRVDAGLASDLDRTQAWAQLENTRAALPALESLTVNARSRLGVLLGRSLQELSEFCPRESIGSNFSIVGRLPKGVLQGVPSDLLRIRPDIRAAERNLAAQTALAGVATAELFPKFTLTGGVGLASLSSENFLDISSKTWSFGPRVNLPIFTAGRLLAQSRAQDERVDQSARQYELTVLQALAEGESTIAAFEHEKSRFETLKQAHNASLQSLSLSRELYQKGLADFLRVIEAQRTAFLAEDVLAQSELQTVNNFIAAYKALGYGWQGEEHPVRSENSSRP